MQPLPSPAGGEQNRDSVVGTLCVKSSVSDPHGLPKQALSEGMESHRWIGGWVGEQLNF